MMDQVKVLKCGVKIPSKFIKDVERLADGLRASLDSELKFQGLSSFQSDIIYQASDGSCHYCYIGDFSIARIDYGDFDFRFSRFLNCRSFYNQLVAIAKLIWELGGQLTFNEDGKHAIYFCGCHF